MEWNVETGESSRLVCDRRCNGMEGDQLEYCICRRWKADKMGVQCICCYGDGSVLLTAGRAIKLWSLEDYTLVKVSSGVPSNS